MCNLRIFQIRNASVFYSGSLNLIFTYNISTTLSDFRSIWLQTSIQTSRRMRSLILRLSCLSEHWLLWLFFRVTWLRGMQFLDFLLYFTGLITFEKSAFQSIASFFILFHPIYSHFLRSLRGACWICSWNLRLSTWSGCHWRV